jgi:hypothetical protein
MSDWKRRTKEVSLEILSSEMANAIQSYIERYNLGPILSEARMLVQTESERTRKGLFGRMEIVKMVVIVTPRWLVWSVEQPNAKPVVLSAQLDHVTVQDYALTPFARLVPDSGLQVSGMFTGASEAASAFIGLEQGDAGDRFKEIVIQAAQDAKK